MKPLYVGAQNYLVQTTHSSYPEILRRYVEKTSTPAPASNPDSYVAKYYIANPLSAPIEVLVRHTEAMGIQFVLSARDGIDIQYDGNESKISPNSWRSLNTRKREIQNFLFGDFRSEKAQPS